MKGFRILLVITILLLVFGIGFLIFSVHSRLTTSEYMFQVDAVLSAASVANQDEPHWLRIITFYRKTALRYDNDERR